MKKTIYRALVATLLSCSAGFADDWDLNADDDDGSSTDNVLFHGSAQVHDLWSPITGLVDQDWYLVASRPYSSYEVVIDGQTGDLDLGSTSLQLLDASGITVIQSAAESAGVLSLSWRLGSGSVTVPTFVRVQGAQCQLTCNGNDSYRIRFYETTYFIPRFNNSATQSTVLLVQNTTDRTCDVVYHFTEGSGVEAGVRVSQLAPRALDVVATASVVPNRSGSVRVAHSCGYGGLSGKAVALEPGTGFTFDTQMVPRPH